MYITEKNIKMLLAKELVTIYYNKKKAQEAEENWEKTFSQREIPEDVLEIKADHQDLFVNILLKNKIISSKTEFRRLINEGAITNLETKEKIKDFSSKIMPGTYRIGKKRFIKIKKENK